MPARPLAKHIFNSRWQVCSCYNRLSTARLNTSCFSKTKLDSTAAASNQERYKTSHVVPSSSASPGSSTIPSSNITNTLTEQQVSELFDAELQQRLASATSAAAVSQHNAGQAAAGGAASSSGSDPAVAAHHVQSQAQQQQQWQPAISSSSGGGGSHFISSGWHPLMASDPWAPLPSPATARRHMPGQLEQLLQQAGVPQPVAAAAVQQAQQAAAGLAASPAVLANPSSARPNCSPKSSSGSSNSSARSSRNSSRAGTRDDANDSLTKQHAPRVLFGKQQQQQQQQQQQCQDPAASVADMRRSRSASQQRSQVSSYLSAFSRLREQQLAQLLEDCQAPTYGSKDLMMQRLALLLHEQSIAGQNHQQDEQHEQHFQVNVGPQTGHLLSKHVATNSSSSSTSTAPVTAVMANLANSSSSRIPHSQRVLAAAAARRRLLEAIVDADEVGAWLMAARAQDVRVIDVRGRAGGHQQLVVATGLSNRHTTACAEAIAWQVREKAKNTLQQQQQWQQTQQAEQQQRQQHDVQQQQQLGSLQAPADQQWQQAVGQPQHQVATGDLQLPERNQASNIPWESHARLAELLPTLSVVGDADWKCVEVGNVVVHVLTARARRFYDLEGLWGGQQGQYTRCLNPELLVETKETIGRDMQQ